jgi:Flp pilus assembly pilin Flp
MPIFPSRFLSILRAVLRHEQGTASIEYAILAVMIAVAIAGTIPSIATKVITGLSTVATAL